MRRILATALVVLSASVLTAATAAAQPMSVELTNRCPGPVGGPVKLALTADIENPAYLGPGPEARRITGKATIPARAVRGLRSVEGVVTANIAVSGTVSLRAAVPLDFHRTTVIPGQDLVVDVAGYTGTNYSTFKAGLSYVDIESIDLTLRGHGRTVKCTRGDQPPARWLEIRTDNVINELLPAPKGLHTTAVGSDSVSLAWNPTSGPFWTVYGYEVAVDDVPAQRLMGPVLSTTITGLQPDTVYWFRVKGIANFGSERRGDPIRVRTLPRR
ncbi:fibronectin type III domain-containing protein [Actinokineospora sp. NBRC 105648]|uniref:fibronectin type III domain-containing protein n=1 Tax=Actinokineospora sp. NBRC 105648 TaxID=3032206 RepID=UPI0024A35ED7|nr:fibronectin type III domain-containing protein [Actinokineospora sp. NBRC 105648]GLZ36490.1 hypothetical protein Acsp05_01150 [Actinokineospora sp. NBRC 105648]